MGMIALTVWSNVVAEMNAAVDECKNGGDFVAHWDRAVAYYTGSKEGTTGTEAGILFHNLADELCQSMSTCGASSSESSGKSFVNREILNLFRHAQRFFQTKKCSDIDDARHAIEKLMIVPHVQGVLVVANERGESDSVVSQNIGATYTAALVPLIHACDEMSARTLYTEMRINNGAALKQPNFDTVKQAVESTYSCLGITCGQVGALSGQSTCRDGLGVETTSSPSGGGNSASTSDSTSTSRSADSDSDDGSNKAAIIGGSIGGVVGLLFLIMCVVVHQTSRGKESNPVAKGNAPEFTEGDTSTNDASELI